MSKPWRSSLPDHYDLMPLSAIRALPVNELAERDAHLYLWAVVPMLDEAFDVIRGWGFKPSTAITWCKPGPGLGGGWRNNTEFLLVGRRGKLPFQATGKGTWYVASRKGHSQKPDLFIDLIGQMSPGPYVELFARRQRLGWDTWGDQAFNTAGFEVPA
jgi:N6-adenosine-specific RNA methylase IME4